MALTAIDIVLGLRSQPVQEKMTGVEAVVCLLPAFAAARQGFAEGGLPGNGKRIAVFPGSFPVERMSRRIVQIIDPRI